MKKSKFVNKTYIGGWLCVHIGVARVTPVFHKTENGTSRNKCAGHRQYYYLLQRFTHDGKFEKMIRLNAAQMKAVAEGTRTVDYFEELFRKRENKKATQKIMYSFCD